MTETELDNVYTHLCKTMTELGETDAPLFLARFAMLAMMEIGDATAVQRLIADAGEAMKGSAPQAAS